MMKNAVKMFRGKYDFLSNMYAVDFEWDGRVYHSSEAAFQSAKSLNPAERDAFVEMSGVTAKRAGKKVALRGDWDTVKVGIMEEIVRAKFSQNPDLAARLMDTGDMELIEGNRWHDSFWGVDLMTGKGDNNLGIILMKIRAELGGVDYLLNVAKLQAEREEAAQQERDRLQSEADALQQQMDALPSYDFVGMEFATKAFGRVTILKREGDYLFFEAAGKEKKFSLPGCIVQGFLVPTDPEVVKVFERRQALQQQIADLNKQIQAIK